MGMTIRRRLTHKMMDINCIAWSGNSEENTDDTPAVTGSDR